MLSVSIKLLYISYTENANRMKHLKQSQTIDVLRDDLIAVVKNKWKRLRPS